MAEENKGLSNFLDRIQGDINGALEGKPADPPAGDDPIPASGSQDPEPKPDEPDLDGLRSPESRSEPQEDPLDDLAEQANKGTPADPKAQEEPAEEPEQGDESADDPLANFDEADRKTIQELLDNRIAEELKLTESAGGAFKRLRTQNRELETKIQELSSRTAEPEALKAATERIAELEAQVKTNEEANSVTRLEDTQAYREAVIEPQQEILSASDAIADRYGVDRDDLANILGTEDRRALSDGINKLLGDDVADADKFELYELSRKAEYTFAKKRELTENAEEALKEAEELTNKQREKQALEQRQQREEAAKETVSRLKEKAAFLLDVVGQDTVDSFVEASAETPIESLPPGDQAFARFAFDALIPLAKHVRKLEGELETANDDILKLRGASPGDQGKGGNGTPSEDTSSAKVEPSQGLSSAVERISGALAKFG